MTPPHPQVFQPFQGRDRSEAQIQGHSPGTTLDSGTSRGHCPCSVTDIHGRNDKFLEDMSHLAMKANCKLVVCPRVENRNDRWIQVGTRLTQRRTVSGRGRTGGTGAQLRLPAEPGDMGLPGWSQSNLAQNLEPSSSKRNLPCLLLMP